VIFVWFVRPPNFQFFSRRPRASHRRHFRPSIFSIVRAPVGIRRGADSRLRTLTKVSRKQLKKMGLIFKCCRGHVDYKHMNHLTLKFLQLFNTYLKAFNIISIRTLSKTDSKTPNLKQVKRPIVKIGNS
jgi:hypothetical protein